MIINDADLRKLVFPRKEGGVSPEVKAAYLADENDPGGKKPVT
jgi:hypothetical protein